MCAVLPCSGLECQGGRRAACAHQGRGLSPARAPNSMLKENVEMFFVYQRPASVGLHDRALQRRKALRVSARDSRESYVRDNAL